MAENGVQEMMIWRDILSWDTRSLEQENAEKDMRPFGGYLGHVVYMQNEDYTGTYSRFGVVLAEAIFFDDPEPFLGAIWESSLLGATAGFVALRYEDLGASGNYSDNDVIFWPTSEMQKLRIVVTDFAAMLPRGTKVIRWPENAYDFKSLLEDPHND